MHKPHTTEKIKIIPAMLTDAKGWLNCLINLDKETHFLLYERNERKRSEKKCTDVIKKIHETRDAVLFFAINTEGSIVGYFKGDVVPLKRKSHVMSVSFALQKNYYGNGKEMEETIVKSIREKGQIKRLEANIITKNVRALKLAINQGWVIEGIKNGSIMINNKLLNEYMVAKYL